MPTLKRPRKGSLQYWPRKRASKFLPRVNWTAIDGLESSVKGFVVYKAGMMSALVKDVTPNSLTLNKNKIIPVTVLECPPTKIFSVRFYKNGKVMTEVLAEGLEKELKRKVKIPKNLKKKIEDFKEYDDVSVLVYSVVKKTNLKKTPDISEIGLKGSIEEKLSWIKENRGKEISITDVFKVGELVDFRGLTRGKGLQGATKRFGLTLRFHKSEKGVRGPGSLGPWHPARVTFKAPQAGQMGMFTRVSLNNKIISIGKSEDKFKGIKNYGDIKTDYIVVSGSVQGPSKRQLIITAPLRVSKMQKKKKFELVELR